MNDASRYERLVKKLFKVKHDFENNHLTFPVSLKGTIGELLTIKALLGYLDDKDVTDIVPIYL